MRSLDKLACDTDTTTEEYWEGYDDAIKSVCYILNRMLDGKDNGSGISSEPWVKTRRRLLMALNNSDSEFFSK